MIRVCHLISGDLWAGAESQTHILLRALSTRNDIDLTAVLLNEGPLAQRLRTDGIDSTVIDESRHGFFSIKRSLTTSLSKIRPDIIHSHRYKENILASLVAQECGVKRLVQTVHGVQEGFSGAQRLKMRAYLFLNDIRTGRRFDCVIAVSDDIRSTLALKYPHTDVVTVRNGIDLSAVVPSRSVAEVRTELGIAPDQPLLGSVGRLVPVKAFDVFLRAASTVAASHPSARFLIAGDGPLRARLEDMASTLGLGQKVIFTGFRDDVLDIVNSLDIYVVSSKHEGIPMSVLEAMALSKPIVSTAVGGMKEIIETGESGILVQPGNDLGIADACNRLLDDKGLAQRMGGEAKARVSDHFSSDTQCGRICSIYRKLLGST